MPDSDAYINTLSCRYMMYDEDERNALCSLRLFFTCLYASCTRLRSISISATLDTPRCSPGWTIPSARPRVYPLLLDRSLVESTAGACDFVDSGIRSLNAVSWGGLSTDSTIPRDKLSSLALEKEAGPPLSDARIRPSAEEKNCCEER